MCTENELIEKAKDLFKRLGGIGNADARIVRGLIVRIESAKNTEQLLQPDKED